MSFGGSAAAMVQSIRSNLAQKRSNRYGKKKTELGIKLEKTEYNFAKVSGEKLNQIKEQIRKDSQLRKRKELILFLSILLSILIIGAFILS